MTLAVKDGVVTDGNGLPAAKVYVAAEEKIGLANYSNVTISASISRHVPDDANLPVALRETAAIVEEFVAEERQTVLASVQGK